MSTDTPKGAPRRAPQLTPAGSVDHQDPAPQNQDPTPRNQDPPPSTADPVPTTTRPYLTTRASETHGAQGRFADLSEADLAAAPEGLFVAPTPEQLAQRRR